MSVEAVRAQIVRARHDGVVTEVEARGIVAAAKRNIKADELGQLRGLHQAITTKEVKTEGAAASIIAAKSTHVTTPSFGETVKTAVTAPLFPVALLFGIGLVALMGNKPGWAALAFIGMILLAPIFIALTVALSPFTALYGTIRGAVITGRD